MPGTPKPQMFASAESRAVGGLAVPIVGNVQRTSDPAGVVLRNADGEVVLPVTEYLSSLVAGGASLAGVRSYALALLRWWRFLAAVGVSWDRATTINVRDFVLWMRFTPKPRRDSTREPVISEVNEPAKTVGSGYAPATINHNLAVLSSFYADRLATGGGLTRNPVPDVLEMDGQRIHAHHNPMQAFGHHRRAALRQKTPSSSPRGLSDHLFDTLFASMGSDRDRALLAFYVSTGARASELLGVSLELVDVGRQLIGVHRKGSGRLQWLPASADAFVWLRLYEERQPRPPGERALWLTRRAPYRPLTYSAMRRVLQRANDEIGTSWTLHDLRHTAAQRMISDPRLSLTDVQWVLGHVYLTTTQIYVQPRQDEVIARVLEHQHRQAERAAIPSPPLAGYRAEVLQTLLGRDRVGD